MKITKYLHDISYVDDRRKVLVWIRLHEHTYISWGPSTSKSFAILRRVL